MSAENESKGPQLHSSHATSLLNSSNSMQLNSSACQLNEQDSNIIPEEAATTELCVLDKLVIETIQDSNSLPIPPSQDVNLIRHESNKATNEKQKSGIELIDQNTSPIPLSQDVNLIEHESNKAADEKQKSGIELIDNENTSPIPMSQDANLIQHESCDDAVIKSKSLQMPATGEATATFTDGVQTEESGTESNTRRSRLVDYTLNVSNLGSNTITPEDEEGAPTILEAEINRAIPSYDYSNNGDLIIPEATLVQEIDDISIANASILEPERNFVVIMGRKISHRVLGWGVAVFLVGVASLAVALTRQPIISVMTLAPSSSMHPTAAPSIQPSSSPTSVIYSDLLNIVTERAGYDDSLFSDVHSTRRMALDWLAGDIKSVQTVNSRSTNATYSNIEIFERFTMALLYYETRGNDWSDSCQFLSSDHICQWKGKRALEKKGVIKCLENRVTELALFKNNLKGSIPQEISLLQELTLLNIAVNDISGPLPQLDNLVNLTYILINNNDFEDVIPNLSTLNHLQTLDISDNEFQGNLFDVGNLTELKTFKVSGNKLSGEVPLSFRDIHLETLHLERTMLNGNVDFLCERIPTMDIDLDCYADIPEIQCNCCVGCTYVARDCDMSSEVAAYIDITEAAQDFTWSVYSIQNNDYHEYFDDDSYITWGSNATERVLIAAGGMYDEGESVNINLCLSFPGDYLLTTETNRTFDNDDVLSVGDYAIPLTPYWGNLWPMFSLDSDGLVNSAPEFLVDDDYVYSIGGADYNYSSAKEVKHMGWGLLLLVAVVSLQ